ncbi:MAG: tetratricopeptide repeat protein [Bacteroidales bacterium]|nr:tetratricopeptide repeat protein [Bacteroidales bacterium]
MNLKNSIMAVMAAAALAAAPCQTAAAAPQQQSASAAATVKKERNHIRSGNKLYNAKRYAEAEVEYRKALQANQRSVIAQYNLALSLIRQSGASQQGGKDNPASQAAQLLQNVVKMTGNDKPLQSRAYYNLGNIAYGAQDYKNAAELYKWALRLNPADNEARYNLRMAQLKMKNNQNKNQNKQNQNKDKDKDKNKPQPQNQKQQPQPQQSDMSQQNVDQILKTMQDEERATQQKMNAAKQRMQQAERMRTRNKW